jgi:hypothetical protein
VVDLLEQSSAWLDGQRKKYLSRPVTYSRAEDEVEVLATVGKTTFNIDSGAGVVESFESRDFLILAADLMLGGVPVAPQRGDRITETQGDQTFVYEVMGPGQELCWRWSDPYRRAMRIHTKQVDVQ